MKKQFIRILFFKIIIISIIFISFQGNTYASDGEVVEWIGVNGGINWTKGTVVAEGLGGVNTIIKGKNNISKAMACRAALTIARRNLLEIIKGVRVQGNTLVSNIYVKNDLIKSSVEGVVRGAIIKERIINDDGSCQVTIQAPLSGPLAMSIYKEVKSSDNNAFLNFKDNIFGFFSLIDSAYAKENFNYSKYNQKIDDIIKRIDRLERIININSKPVEAVTVKENEVSGLIIDARGSNFIPSLHPRVRKIKGKVIYPGDIKEDFQKNGRLISLFMNDLILAQNHPRVGNKPLVVKALRTYGKYRTEIVLSEESAMQVSKLIKNGFLKHAEVIIVMD